MSRRLPTESFESLITYPEPVSPPNLISAKTAIEYGLIKPNFITGIIDGNTIQMVVDGEEIEIRLYGIDAPEKKQAYGQQATMALESLTDGREIWIKIIDTDEYGRKIAVIFADNDCINQEMIKSGYAWVYPEYCKITSCNKWREYEAQARVAERGLWADAAATPPWEYQHE